MTKEKIILLVVTGTILLSGCSAEGISADFLEAEKIQEETEQAQTPLPIKEVESVSEGNYAYECLEEEEKRAYDEILDCLINQEEKVTVETESADELEKVYEAVMADYGEIFWNSGYVYTVYTQAEEVVGMEFAPKYTKSLEERKELQLEIDQVVDEIIQGIDREASDYEKAKYVFEYLVTNVEYSLESEENQNIISVFLNHSTVCQGYSCATQYLLKKLGIMSTVINGTANGEAHAWNLVLLDGAYYYLDTTWGNSAYLDAEEECDSYINYNYFAVTTEEITTTHTPAVTFELPECVDTTDNYYVKEGLLFSEWSPEEVGAFLKNEYNGERKAISFKFETEELYDSMKTYLIDEQHIADYCEGISSVFYIEDKEQNVLTIKF
ncbi:MAG: transglutaminase domain-containing protein [Roseburia sp.]